MTEGRALGVAAGLHLLLLAALSVSLAGRMAPDAEPDVTPIEFVEVADAATVTAPPKPSLEAAPREPEPPAAAPEMPEAPPMPQVPVPPVPAKAAPDVAAQDAIAEAVAAAPTRRPPPSKAKPAAAAGQNAALVDRSKPQAAKAAEPQDFAKSIEEAIPKQAKLSAIQAATLEQAIRAQIAPCWNPPIGGADVADMTAVLRIRLNRDGTVAAPPEFVSQTGATAGNQAYARAFVETARRAVLRCAPLQLPADLFAHWREFELNFDPRLMT